GAGWITPGWAAPGRSAPTRCAPVPTGAVAGPSEGVNVAACAAVSGEPVAPRPNRRDSSPFLGAACDVGRPVAADRENGSGWLVKEPAGAASAGPAYGPGGNGSTGFPNASRRPADGSVAACCASPVHARSGVAPNVGASGWGPVASGAVGGALACAVESWPVAPSPGTSKAGASTAGSAGRPSA